jgi:fumarylacetoacetate (FAA) hydrolase family protein
MKANQLLLTATLASAIGPAIESSTEKKTAMQTKPAAIQLPIEGELPFSFIETHW